MKKRIETIDFKTFCEGGSPEYVAAKRKLKELYQKHQERVGNFAESSLSKIGESSQLKLNPSSKSFSAYSLYINPLALFDVHFMLAAGAVVLIAVLEKKLAENGIEFAAVLSGFLHIAFPLVAFGSLLVLISKLGVFL